MMIRMWIWNLLMHLVNAFSNIPSCEKVLGTVNLIFIEVFAIGGYNILPCYCISIFLCSSHII